MLALELHRRRRMLGFAILYTLLSEEQERKRRRRRRRLMANRGIEMFDVDTSNESSSEADTEVDTSEVSANEEDSAEDASEEISHEEDISEESPVGEGRIEESFDEEDFPEGIPIEVFEHPIRMEPRDNEDFGMISSKVSIKEEDSGSSEQRENIKVKREEADETKVPVDALNGESAERNNYGDSFLRFERGKSEESSNEDAVPEEIPIEIVEHSIKLEPQDTENYEEFQVAVGAAASHTVPVEINSDTVSDIQPKTRKRKMKPSEDLFNGVLRPRKRRSIIKNR